MGFLNNILNIILFLIMLGVLITIHELGHFIAAKAFKVYVFEFAIGFGPKIFRKKKGETYYSLRALPLGGFVAMYGEEDEIPPQYLDAVHAKDENNEPVISRKRSLLGINRGKRAIIMSAGIVMNLILGYMIFLFSNGVLTQTGLSIKLNVESGSQAETLGILTNDRIDFAETTIGGRTIQYFGEGKLDQSAAEPQFYVLFSPKSFNALSFGGDNILLVRKDATDLYSENAYYLKDLTADDVLTFDATFLRGEDYDTAERIVKSLTFITVLKDPSKPASGYTFESLGFGLTKRVYRNGFADTFRLANRDFVTSVTAVGRGIQSLFTQGLKNISGPIGIFNMSASTLQNQGVGQFLFLWGLISINLALFNLLPFPPLDGWHLLVVTIEAITRQEISPRFKQIASLIGAILLIGLTIAILFKDIFSLIGVLL
ncbi:MAG: site-2 protease family protein [Bacilli bacterium]